MDSNSIVTQIEAEHDVRAIQSDAKGLFYLEDDNTSLLGIMTVRNGKTNYVVLNKVQALMLAKEIKGVCELRYGCY